MASHRDLNLVPKLAGERKTVGPLRRLLMTLPLETVLAFMHQSHFSFSLTRRRDGYYRVVIYGDGIVNYGASSGESARAAFCDALAKFLTAEQKDFHVY